MQTVVSQTLPANHLLVKCALAGNHSILALSEDHQPAAAPSYARTGGGFLSYVAADKIHGRKNYKLYTDFLTHLLTIELKQNVHTKLAALNQHKDHMRIFIINLKSSPERRAKMEAQLNALGLPHEFIEAVDGKLMSENERKSVSQKINYAFVPGEIGCALSHQKIYKKMIEDNIENAFILEDDVILNESFKKIAQTLIIPSDKSTVVLLSRPNKYFKKPLKKITGSYHLHKTQQATTAHCYALNKKAAQSLLNGLYPIWMTADKWSLFEDLSMISVYSVMPTPVHLSDESKASTINVFEDGLAIHKEKKRIWEQLMLCRPLKAKLKNKYRRALAPIFGKVINQGKG
ncbi:glycosyltransferase family 25 protein [Enterobacter ludwigii]